MDFNFSSAQYRLVHTHLQIYFDNNLTQLPPLPYFTFSHSVPLSARQLFARQLFATYRDLNSTFSADLPSPAAQLRAFNRFSDRQPPSAFRPDDITLLFVSELPHLHVTGLRISLRSVAFLIASLRTDGLSNPLIRSALALSFFSLLKLCR